MSRLIIVEGNSNDKDNVRVLMVKGEKGEQGDLNHNDIIDNLTSTATDKVLSANQGKQLKDLIDNNKTITNKKPYYFNNIAEMKAYDLVAGDVAITLGYYAINDGGTGKYKIVNDNTLIDDGGSIIDLTNGLKAKLIIDINLSLEQFGVYSDGLTDCTDEFNYALDYARKNNYSIVASKKSKFLVSNSLDFSNVNINLNNSEIIADDEIDIITIDTNSFYGKIENINIDCNNNASSGINIIEGRKHIFNNINIYNVKNTGIIYTVGYENMFNNINITGYPNSANSIGIHCITADSHFSNIIIIDCHTAIKSQAENWFTNIHAWISNDSKNIYYHSKFIEWLDGEMHLNQVYADTYHYGIYLNGTGICGIHANQFSFNQKWSIVSTVDLQGETTVLIYQNTENAVDTRDTSLLQVDCPAVFLNDTYTLLSNKEYYGNIEFSKRNDLNLDAITFELTNNDESITYSQNKLINLGDKIEFNIIGSINLTNYTGDISSVVLGVIPQWLLPLIRPVNNMIGISTGEYDQDIDMKYMYVNNAGNIITNLTGLSGQKWFKLHFVCNKRF